MFRRRKRIRPTDYAPPAGGSAEVRHALSVLHAYSEKIFKKVFLFEEMLAVEPHERADVLPLARCGLLEERRPNHFTARARVFPVFKKFIATDLLSHQAEDQVFSLMFEQIYLLRNTGVRGGDEVLELCAGSGVNSIFAAEVAESVTAVELSPRALAFAAFNRDMNEPRAPLTLLEGSLFEPLEEGRRFDTILINPPFELVPPGAGHFLHSHGGADGLDVIRKCLEDAPRFLKPGGRFEIITYSPGTEEDPALIPLLEQAFPGHGIEVHLLDLEPIGDLCRPFRKHPGYVAWRRWLEAQGHTTNFFLYARVTDGAPKGTHRVDPREEADRCRLLATEWT